MRSSLARWLAPAVFGAGLTGCDLAPKYHVPLVSVPVSYKEASKWTPAVPADSMPRSAWWRMFGDPTLDGLEAQIDNGNPDLAAYLADFQQARAIAAEAYAGVYPTLGAGGHVTTNRQSARRPLRGHGQPNQYLDNAIDIQANYEIDLWDRVANAVKAGRAAVQASAADLESVRLSLHAQLATNYAELRGFDVQERILTDAVSQYRQALQMTEARFAGKIASGLDVSRAQTQLHDAQAALIDVQSSRALVEHSIALLIGKPPAELTIAPEPQQIRETEVPAGVPSTILERRPDIASAERLVQAANATIGETRAAFYPTISLNLIYGLQDTGFNLASLPNSFWSVGPGVFMPLFEGGLRDAEEQAALAAYRRTVADYRSTVLNAFGEVEDSASNLRLLGKEESQAAQATEAARQTVNMATALYRDGATNYLEVVVAQTAELQAELAEANLHTRRAEACISLVQALGGGWRRQDLPSLHPLMEAETR